MIARARPTFLFILTFFAIVFSSHEARAQGNEHPNADSLSRSIKEAQSSLSLALREMLESVASA